MKKLIVLAVLLLAQAAVMAQSDSGFLDYRSGIPLK